MSPDLFACSVYPAWSKALRAARDARSRVLIFFPYLKGQLALRLLNLVPPDRCEIYTVCSIDNFASGASCVQTYRKLIESKYKIFHIEGLHAKVVLVRGEYATLGSQNLTPAGTRNLEVSIGLSSPEDVKALESGIETWCRLGRRIDLDEIRDIEEHLAPVERKLQHLRAAIESAEESVTAAREQRIRDEQNRRQAIRECTKKIASIIPDGRVPQITAEEFISVSAFKKVKYGGMVRAEWLARHVVGPETDLRLDPWNGRGNKFLVGRAIQRCAMIAKHFAEDPGDDLKQHFDSVKVWLRDAVREEVARHDDQKYQGFYSKDEGWIWLGMYGISVGAFVNEFLKRTNLEATLCKSTSR
ncbi:MAG TPA: phospholipase D-like domain-containing protein [Planctomycetaceae bacterium]|jgi:hypothetical protein